MSWESSALYYKRINEEVKRRLGDLNSAEILMHSVNFAEIEHLQHEWNWEALTEIMIKNVKRLEVGGADFVLICTNTMHKMAAAVQENISIPLIHIADATAQAIKKAGYKKVALLWTAFTMEQDFYKGRLVEHYRLQVMIPNETQRKDVHRIIYKELCEWKILDDSREIYKAIIADMKEQGAQCVILGCTEITMLISQTDSVLPVFDTTQIHAMEAVNVALEK